MSANLNSVSSRPPPSSLDVNVSGSAMQQSKQNEMSNANNSN